MANNKVLNKVMLVALLFLTTLSFTYLFGDNNNVILAEYTGGNITREDFDTEFQKIPQMYRSQFSTLEGQKRLLDNILINSLFYQKAVELGVDKDPKVLESIEQAILPLYAKVFREEEITNKVNISDADIRSYYADRKERFTESTQITILYLGIEDEDSAEIVKNLLVENADFIDIMNRYSTNEPSKRNEGVIRNIRGNGYIPGVGRDELLDKALQEAPLNTWQGPVINDTDYHFFKVTERIPARLKPLDEVRDDIVNRLRPMKEIELTNKIFEDLKTKYSVNIDDTKLETVNFTMSPDLAQKNPVVIVTSSVDELKLNSYDIIQRIQRLSHQEKSQLNNPEFLKKQVDDIIQERLFSYEAHQKGYKEKVEKDSDAEQTRRNFILRNLFDQLVTKKAEPTDAQIEEYYQNYHENFTSKEQRTAQLFIFDTNRAARKARSSVVKALKKNNEAQIEKIISESNFTDNNGIIENLTRATAIPQIGKDESILNTIWNTKLNDLSKITRSDSDKHFFVRITEDYPAQVYPLSEVKERIVNHLIRQNRETLWNNLQEELKEDYNAIIHSEKLATLLSPLQLFELAEDSQKRKRHTEAIKYYDQIIEYHKNNEDDYKALFMKAFLIAEELKNNDDAVVLFKKLLNEYPYSDLHDSAEFMIKSLEDEDFDVFKNTNE